MDRSNIYKEKMDLVQVPSYLKDRVLEEVRSLSIEQPAELVDSHLEGQAAERTETQHDGQTGRADVTQKNPATTRNQTLRVLVPVLSAAAVLLIAFLTLPLFSGSSEDSAVPESNGVLLQTEDSFSLRAYTTTPEAIVRTYELTPHATLSGFEGLITFGAMGTGALSGSDLEAFGGGTLSDSNAGIYTACLFSIEGDGIVFVDFETSVGQMYCNASQTFSELLTNPLYSDSPESQAIHTALREKLGGDYVPGPSSVMRALSDENEGLYSGWISGNRPLGQSPSIETDLVGGNFNLEETGFGFYLAGADIIDNPFYEQDYFRTPSALMATLDGQLLKLRVHYVDESTASQTYILRVKKMKVVLPIMSVIDVNGRDVTIPYLPEEAAEGDLFVYVLFGELVHSEES